MKKISIILVVVASLFMGGCSVKTGKDGYYTGYVTGVQREGYIWKNYRIFVKAERESSNEDEFCIEQTNSTLANELKELMESETKMTVEYDTREKFLSPNLCEGDYITGYKIIN